MEKTLILLHGYGVRGWFWEGFAEYFRSQEGGQFTRVLTPDLEMDNIKTLVDTTTRLVEEEASRNGGVYLLGHSLGGAVASVVADRLGDDLVRKLVCIATPYGRAKSSMGGITRFLIRHHMLPEFLIRPQFYSRQTPVAVQKAMFARVVPESADLLDTVTSEVHFNTPILQRKLPQPSLVVCSAADKVVPSAQSTALATTIGADVYVFPNDRNVGHDDFVAAPAVRAETQSVVGAFFTSRNS